MDMKFNRLMIGVDFSEMDETLLNYANFLTRVLNVTDVYLMHIEPKLEISPELAKKYGFEIDDTGIERYVDKMKALAEKHMLGCTAELHYSVHEGKVQEKLTHWIQEKSIDLILVGRKINQQTSRIIPRRLIERTNASIIFITQSTTTKIDNIHVAVDYSKYSKNALLAAIDVADDIPNEVKITCENVYSVPLGYYKTGKTFEEFSKIMKSNAENDYKEFIDEVKPKMSVTAHFDLDTNDNPADEISKFAIEDKADLIVIGAKGRTFGSSILMGSVTEKLVSLNIDIPLMVVKNKNEEWGFWKAIQNI